MMIINKVASDQMLVNNKIDTVINVTRSVKLSTSMVKGFLKDETFGRVTDLVTIAIVCHIYCLQALSASLQSLQIGPGPKP